MKLLYSTEPDAGGRHLIYYAVWDRDWFSFSPSVNRPLTEMSIDEIEANKELCIDLARRLRREDSAGDRKYYIDADGDIIEKEGWVEYHDDRNA